MLALLAAAWAAAAQRADGTRLTIEVRASEGAAPTGYTLACDPAGGTLPGAAEACDRLAASGAPF
ncbi:MAG TPA: SSI family serine proteinase inhibitor, partial [Methylomirabilota bacterium]|nr:SSI family serine proteinase inhibitor [Methylomirabilota bacterium]